MLNRLMIVLITTTSALMLLGSADGPRVGINIEDALPGVCLQGDLVSLRGGGLYQCGATNNWSQVGAGGPGGLPSGAVFFITTGTCPAGSSEVIGLNGVSLRGTLAANGDVGTSTGSDTATPTVASLTAAAQTFTGDATTVPALAFGTLAATQAADTFGTTKFTTSGSGTAAFTSETARGAITISGSTATGSLSPLGHNATSAVTGTLNPVNTVPSSLKVIFCAAN